MYRLAGIQRKILQGKDLERWLAIARFQNKKIVFTNGCFDILHKGHIEYLSAAADLGDLLIIGLNSDESVKRLKGSSRPYLDGDTRALILASLGFVAVVVFFDTDTPYELIRTVAPDILVKGGDYRVEEIVGYDLVAGKGGKVITIPITPGYSSTRVITQITGNK